MTCPALSFCALCLHILLKLFVHSNIIGRTILCLMQATKWLSHTSWATSIVLQTARSTLNQLSRCQGDNWFRILGAVCGTMRHNAAQQMTFATPHSHFRGKLFILQIPQAKLWAAHDSTCYSKCQQALHKKSSSQAVELVFRSVFGYLTFPRL